jgi:hypothetical protein
VDQPIREWVVNFTPTATVLRASKVSVLKAIIRGGALHSIRMQVVLDAGTINRCDGAVLRQAMETVVIAEYQSQSIEVI